MKILLVDDHALFREGVALLLQPLVADDAIYQVGTCAEAIDVLQRNAGISLVLMDIHLSGTSGLDAIALIREQFPTLPIVGLSSMDDKQTILRAIDAGAMGFIPKSSSSAVMFAALQLVLCNGIYIPPEAIARDKPLPDSALSPRSNRAPPGEQTSPADLGLTPRQADVLFQILQGKSAKAICRDLGLSTSTVKVHTSAALRALNVTTRTQAVIAAARIGLVFSE